METIAMSRRERGRLEVFSRVRRGELTLVKAAEFLGIGYRQTKRVWARYQGEGDAGLVHRLRGRSSNHQADVEEKARVLSLYETKYGDYGPTLAAECLEEEDGLLVAPETLRQWLLTAGLWKKRRRRGAHRQRRERREQRGELVQMDGSHHDWFEGRRDWAVLMVMIDDATGAIYARFFEGETTFASMETFQRYVQRHGLPRALYTDRDSIYRSDREPTAAEVLAGQEPRTQFGRAMEQLGVGLILAGSPQAKGRVERCNGTLQDRLVKALRRAGIDDLSKANAFLEKTYLEEFNARFAVRPRKPGDLHRRVPRDVDLNWVLSDQETRVVQNDWTVRWRNRWFQLTAANHKLALVGRQVIVCEQVDGSIRLRYRSRDLAYQEIASPPQKASEEPTVIRSNQGQKPAADHPWRRRLLRRAPPRSSPAGRACFAPARYARLRSASPPRPVLTPNT
jgi:hypothetical protein